MQISGCFIGVDVGKFELQVAGYEGAILSGIVPNNRSGIVGWLKRLPAGSVIAMEATGGSRSCWPAWRTSAASWCTS
ncbi:Uncharacterised protein [Achromobacter ruhlandii]|nr:Uncharacterised protein [Achromobacter ruhlandii]CUK22886.1 Uncharacterised protein [Achromobacter ruhlandii]